MKQSQLFGKTAKEERKDATLPSHRLLLKGGFIRESVAGRYYLLPLGQRVHSKIVQIIRQEMDAAGAQEMSAPVLHPLELWQETNRDNAGNFGLMLVTDKRGAQFALGGTAEEMFVDVVRKFQISYKDLPFNIYQFSQKFRDELRVRGGLLRVREFMMKDAYSFDADAETFSVTYERMAEAYSRIFARMGLPTKKVLADNGYIGGEYCHEYIVDCDAGESRYLETEDGSYCAHEDVAQITLKPMNEDEPIRPMRSIDQPAWVKTMDDNVKHYGEPAWRYLKNVVYKRIDTGEIIIAVVRGDLEVNKTKLEKVVGAIELLEEATEEDLARLGTKHGFVHSWGHEARYVADLSLKTVRNFIGGQKEEETDTIDVNYGRDFTADIEADIILAQEGDMSADGKVLRAARGVEVGNIFQLGTFYTDKMAGAVYQDSDGQQKPFYMGCYGIGVGRTMATIVERSHNERGIMWPKSVAPFSLHIVSLSKNDQVRQDAEALYLACQNAGIDVLYDDRDLRAGEKFADSDLIGIPTRVVVSEKSNAELGFEVVDRASGAIERLSQGEVIARGLPPADVVDY